MKNLLAEVKEDIEALKPILEKLKKYSGNRTYKSIYKKLLLKFDKDYKKFKMQVRKLNDETVAKIISAIEIKVDELINVSSSREKLKVIDELSPLWNDIEIALEEKTHTLSPKIFSEELINRLGEKFKTEIKDLKLVYGKSGTCTAFLLRKMLEKALFIALCKNGIDDKKLKDAQGKYAGLSTLLDLASREKVDGTPFMTPHTIKKIEGIKFLGDAAAHNFLIDIEMEEIEPQMPFIIAAFKELSKRFEKEFR